MPRRLTVLLIVPLLALSACGSGKKVDAATYTCAQFNKSLRTSGDNTSGNFLNQLRKQAGLGQSAQIERRELALGVYFACRGKAGTTRPAQQAIAVAKQIKAHKFHIPGLPKKKSTK